MQRNKKFKAYFLNNSERIFNVWLGIKLYIQISNFNMKSKRTHTQAHTHSRKHSLQRKHKDIGKYILDEWDFLIYFLFQSPKPEQSVMQALESLNEQQVCTINLPE